MNIITQQFKQISEKAIKSLKNKEIKAIIGRDRLKFSYQSISYYVQIIFEHSILQKSFLSLYKTHKPKVIYSVFMKNIRLFSSLFKYLFYRINKFLNIKASKLMNIVDSTLIEEKKSNFINKKDWIYNKVTTRIKHKIKIRTCGSKGLVFINRFGQIYRADLLQINHSDQNILKDFSLYLSSLQGILLADRGFSNKAVRTRLEQIKTSIFNPNQTTCKLISPYHYKEKKQLTQAEFKLYKRRWKIETLFQNLKHNYSDNKLNLTGKYNKILKQAKFYSTLIQFNFSTL